MFYIYTAIDRAGTSKTGQEEALSERELAEKLKRVGLVLIEAREKKIVAAKLLSIRSISGRLRWVTLVERMMFARNLAVMIGAGLSLVKALSALEEQVDNIKFKAIIADLRESVLKGKSFADGLRRHEDVFGPLFVHMIESGEVSGKLEYVLKLLARQMKRDHDLIVKVRGAMIYPAIIITTLIFIGILMMIYVVPTLTKTFRELNIVLPPTTRFIIGASDFLVQYYLLVLGLIPVVSYIGWSFLKTSMGGRLWGTVSLRLPIFGPLVKKINSARFARILASLISSGLSITKALEVTANVVGNIHFKESLKGAVLGIEKGRPFSSILKERPDLFQPLVTQMLEVGEETGTTSRMLLRLAIFYESEVSSTTKNFSSVIEPVLMIIIGVAVGFFAISMIQPIYSGVGGL